MPRRRQPVRRGSIADAAIAETYRDLIRTQVLSLGIFAPLSGRSRDQLLDELVQAVGHAKNGLASIVGGKRARPAAWTLDIFTRDVCDALKKAGISVFMTPDPELSDAQAIVRDLALAVGLPSVGTMFKQMQRARRIEKH